MSKSRITRTATAAPPETPETVPTTPLQPAKPNTVPTTPVTPVQPQLPPPHGALTASGLTDVLSVVHAFIYKFAQIPIDNVPELSEKQIIRGWQALGLTPAVDEICIITLLNSVRTSFDSPSKCKVSLDESAEPSKLRITQRLEHLVQVDFAALSQRLDPSISKRRADQIYMIAHSPLATGFFYAQNPRVSCLYCDPPTSLGELDGSHALRSRHVLNIHVAELQVLELPVSTFGGVDLYIENALVHHKP